MEWEKRDAQLLNVSFREYSICREYMSVLDLANRRVWREVVPDQEERAECKIRGNHACDPACKGRKRGRDS